MDNLFSMLETLSGVLHWLGKYAESNAVTHFLVIARCRKVTSLDELVAWREAEEREAAARGGGG